MVVEKIDTLQTVELAEGVEIRLRIAGPALRAVAHLIDLLIRVAVFVVLGIGLNFIGSLSNISQVTGGLVLVAWFLLDWFYPVVFEAGKRGATPGKRAMGLRVVQSTGAPITVGQAIIRNFLRFIDTMPMPLYLFGLTSCVATRRFQRLGDLAAGTVVIYHRPPVFPVVAAPPPMSATPPPVGLSADETKALVLFRERAGLWSEGRRVEIADHASSLSGARGTTGVTRLMSMAHWVQRKRENT